MRPGTMASQTHSDDRPSGCRRPLWPGHRDPPTPPSAKPAPAGKLGDFLDIPGNGGSRCHHLGRTRHQDGDARAWRALGLAMTASIIDRSASQPCQTMDGSGEHGHRHRCAWYVLTCRGRGDDRCQRRRARNSHHGRPRIRGDGPGRTSRRVRATARVPRGPSCQWREGAMAPAVRPSVRAGTPAVSGCDRIGRGRCVPQAMPPRGVMPAAGQAAHRRAGRLGALAGAKGAIGARSGQDVSPAVARACSRPPYPPKRADSRDGPAWGVGPSGHSGGLKGLPVAPGP